MKRNAKKWKLENQIERGGGEEGYDLIVARGRRAMFLEAHSKVENPDLCELS